MIVLALLFSALCASSAFTVPSPISLQQFHPSSALAGKDWDAILRDDDDDGNVVDKDVPPDMRYNPRNCMRQNKNFVAIREAAGKDLTNDIYCCEPGSETFWFVGKTARVSDVSVAQTVARQWNMIETHAANLRPLDLFPSKGSLEIWTAPGDSELDVAYNRPNICFEKMEKEIEGAASVKNALIGFQGEMYEGQEEGFRTWRLRDGRPARPEVESPNEGTADAATAPTDEEMQRLEKALEGQDIQKLWEEQQRRMQEE